MKVKTLLIAAFAAFSLSAVAQVSDDHGTSATDKVLIKDTTVKVGETVDLDIIFDTQTPYAAAQADFTMPEGLTPIQNEDDEWFSQTNSPRWKKHTLATNNPGGIYRFLVYHGTNKTFAAGNDAMLTIRCKVEKEGALHGTVTKVHWSTGIVGGVGDGDGPDTEFTVTAVTSGITDVNAAQAVKTYKVIENGQIYIIAGDKKYNVMGAEVK